MKFEDLDKDTQLIIETMSINTGWKKEKCILALVEFGMMTLKASVNIEQRNRILAKLFEAVNSNSSLKATAEIYNKTWEI